MSSGRRFVPTLQHFILRGEVLKLYRQCVRTVYKVPRDQRPAMLQWVNQEFVLNKDEQDPELIKMHVIRGKMHLEKFQRSNGIAGTS